MTKRPFKIGIAGTHSTGKSTFALALKDSLESLGKKVGQVQSLATQARAVGFPILTEHTIDSTFWIIASCMKQEAELSLRSDVIIVDRPVPDAVGYLEAALSVSGRQVDADRLSKLKEVARAYSTEYDVLVVTELDSTQALGPNRDQNAKFRRVAGERINEFVRQLPVRPLTLTSSNNESLLTDVIARAVVIQ